ncbi:DUF2062 domain-containing protein [Chakrabartia godavariana]|nr:DUF2062 domain-containing protein [Chakrabartia godavariana]
MSRLGKWIRSQAPSQESFERSRFLRPFAQRVFHPALWRFTRRSVPRGVALGLLVGIFLLIPGIQIAGAALLALPVRANIPVAAAMTFLSNPATTPFIIAASIYVGNSALNLGADVTQFEALMERNAPLSAWAEWLVSSAAPALLTGLFLIALLSAVIGYVVAAIGWRIWLQRKWKSRTLRRRTA